jgi:YbbR domain-containing protein
MIDFLRRYVFRNFGLKLVSLVAAVLVWMAVAHDPAMEVAVRVPVEFQHAPGNLEISTVNIPEVQIRVSGPGRLVRQLAQSEVHAVVDLAGATPGEHTYDLTGAQIRLPHEIELLQVVPPELRLTFDWRAWREVPIQARVLGVSPDARLGVHVEPSTALILGPQQEVEHIHTALTDAIDLTGITGATTFSGIHIFVTDPMVRVTRPLTVSVTVAPASADSNAGSHSSVPGVR